MANFLRTIRQARWLRPPSWDWLGSDDIQSDALLDLRTEDNTLSVYKVESGEDIDRVVVALAANREEVQNVDYAIFDDTALTSSNISFIHKEGDTPDYEVNQLHYDVTNLTILSLVQMAQAVLLGERKRVLAKTLKPQVQVALERHQLDRTKMKEKLLGQIR